MKNVWSLQALDDCPEVVGVSEKCAVVSYMHIGRTGLATDENTGFLEAGAQLFDIFLSRHTGMRAYHGCDHVIRLVYFIDPFEIFERDRLPQVNGIVAIHSKQIVHE